MKSILTSVFVLLVASAPALAQQEYGWTISSSATDPLVNAGPLLPGVPFQLYLWLYCSSPDGMAAAAFDVATPAGITNSGFFPLNGFLAAGDAYELLLAVPGCPSGPVVAGYWDFLDPSGTNAGSFCMVNSSSGYGNVTYDCEPPVPQDWPNDIRGYAYGIPLQSCDDPLCTGPIANDPLTWGSLKNLYR